MEQKYEIRTYGDARRLSVRSDGEGENKKTIIEGYGIVFDSKSRILVDWDEDEYFYEVIDKGAVTMDTLNKCDVILNVNHDDERMLARSYMGQGSLRLSVDAVGVKYECEAPNDDLGRSIVEHIRRGDYFGSSFKFVVPSKECMRYDRDEEGVLTRTILQIDEIRDVSVVRNPAYMATTTGTRDYRPIEESIIPDDLKEYYASMNEEILK